MSQSLKIFQVGSHESLEWSGAIQMLRLSQSLADRGHDLHCFLNTKDPLDDGPEAAKRQFEEAGLRLTHLNMTKWGWGPKWRFRRMLKAERPDVVHAHGSRAIRFVYWAALGIRLPCFAGERGAVELPKLRTFESRIVEAAKLNCMLTGSEEARRRLLTRTYIPGSKIALTISGVPLDRFSPDFKGDNVRQEFRIPPKSPVIVCCSRIEPKKGIEILVDSFIRLLEDRPEARLLLVGPGDTKKTRVFIKEEKLKGKIVLTGYREDVRPYLAVADVVVCPSPSVEGLPATLIEALAMERPVVCAVSGAVWDLTEIAETGIWVPPDDAPTMTDALTVALNEREEVKAMAKSGAEWVAEHCAEPVRAAHVESIYEETIERGIEGVFKRLLRRFGLRRRRKKSALNRSNP